MISKAGPADWADWRLARQRSLAEDPQAFASSVVMWTGDQDTEARWRARLEDGPCYLAYEHQLACEDGRHPIGMVGGAVSGGWAELISMWVAVEARGLGVGRELVRSVVEWAGDRPLRLRVVDGNDAALGLYSSQGFVLDTDGPDAEGCRTMILR